MIKRIRNVFAVLAAVLVALVLVPGTPAHAGNAQESLHSHKSQGLMTVRESVVTVTAADVAAAVATNARAGEGVIRITTRVCGNANNWQGVAAANGIRGPVYLVLLGQRLTVSCSAGASIAGPGQQSAPAVSSSSGWAMPVRACITSPYGQWRGTYAHEGVDLGAGYGVAIHAIAAGTVSTAWQSGAGNYTTINHGGGLYSVYMHQSRHAVWSGWVGAGQVIGYVGQSGNANGPHLHLEVHTAGLWHGKVNPVSFLAARGVRLGC